MTINRLHKKKTVAQGLLDIALLTANASQLSNLLETENHPNYELAMGLLLASITLQILVALGLVLDERINKENDSYLARIEPYLDDAITVGAFLITAINIFVAAFIGHSKVSNRQLCTVDSTGKIHGF